MFFFFNDTATTEIYTLSLHDALPIYQDQEGQPDGGLRVVEQHVPDEPATSVVDPVADVAEDEPLLEQEVEDRKSTRLNSSHANISYAVFCLKKKKNSTHSVLLFH